MGKPSAKNKDIPLRLPLEAAAAVTEESGRLKVSEVEFIRSVLSDYFKEQGKSVDFTVAPTGGRRDRLTDQDTLNLVMSRVNALKLPAPDTEGKIGRFTYDLVWADRQAAVEISKKPRPDLPGWTIAHISPTDSRADIDAKLKALPIK